jgi:hypothetical protein
MYPHVWCSQTRCLCFMFCCSQSMFVPCACVIVIYELAISCQLVKYMLLNWKSRVWVSVRTQHGAVVKEGTNPLAQTRRKRCLSEHRETRWKCHVFVESLSEHTNVVTQNYDVHFVRQTLMHVHVFSGRRSVARRKGRKSPFISFLKTEDEIGTLFHLEIRERRESDRRGETRFKWVLWREKFCSAEILRQTDTRTHTTGATRPPFKFRP